MTTALIENWRAVPGYEGLYEVSSRGRVRSVERTAPCNRGTRRIRPRVLRPVLRGRDGIASVSLSKDGEATPFYLHLLVRQAFGEGS